MNLSQNFTLAEFTHSDTALRLGIDNSLPDELLATARATALMLEAVRHHLSYLARREVPIHITSGYRSLTLNQRIGSSSSSDHVRALAADIKAPAFGTPLEICRALEPVREQLGIGQLIHEYGAWVHISTRKPLAHVNQVLTIDEDGTRPGLA
jgi:zinc D-Ala-D-Ala carboxypeptidase